jgi:alkylhydroperoxidase family enzyme
MARIEVIPEDQAEGELKEAYEGLREPWGGVDNILKIHGLNLPSMLAHNELYRVVMRGDPHLSRVQREMIAVVVSAANHCHY